MNAWMHGKWILFWSIIRRLNSQSKRRGASREKVYYWYSSLAFWRLLTSISGTGISISGVVSSSELYGTSESGFGSAIVWTGLISHAWPPFIDFKRHTREGGHSIMRSVPYIILAIYFPIVLSSWRTSTFITLWLPLSLRASFLTRGIYRVGLSNNI